MSAYLHIGEMTWPDPNDPTAVEWRLRYGESTRTDLLVAASFIGAYRQLVYDSVPVRDAKVRAIRLAAKKARQETFDEGATS